MKKRDKILILDFLGRKITLKKNVNTVVSLCPSHTQTLFDLGLEEKVVGITKFCPKPKHKNFSVLGGTKNLDLDAIFKLSPDLVLSEKEENKKEQIEELDKYHLPCFVTENNSLENSNQMILRFGEIFHCEEKTNAMVQEIENNFKKGKNLLPKTYVYFIWKNPYWVVGPNTYIHSVFSHLGAKNVFGESFDRYPKTTIEEIETLSPEILFLSTEPYQFSEKHVNELQKLFPKSQALLVDGAVFSWHGSVAKKIVEYTKKLLL